MAINKVRMQRGMSWSAFTQLYGTHTQCQAALIALRWPDGFVCSACGHRRASSFTRGFLRYWQCSDGRRQTSPYAGTMLQGERVGGKPGRGSENKVSFVAAVELHDGCPVRVRFDRGANFSFEALRHWHKRAPASGCRVTSDGLIGFEVIGRDGKEHQVIQAPRGKVGTEIAPCRWLNTVVGNLKTGRSGVHHALDFGEYGHRYLADAQYRFNRRLSLKSRPTRLPVALVNPNP